MECVEPVFFKDSDYQDTAKLTTYDVCTAVGRIVGTTNLDGVQNIRGIWRIYTKSRASRLELLLKKELQINRLKVPLYDSNPAVTGDTNDTEKIIVKDIPLSVANNEIEVFLLSKGIILTSPIRYSKVRDQNGDLTNFKNGDRFVYAKSPINPTLDRNVKIGDFRARLYHNGQFLNCKICGKPGHKAGTPECEAYDPEADIIAFRSEKDPLSNFFPCSLEYNGEQFNSSEQAMQYLKAKDTHNTKVAKSIMDAGNARGAWSASRAIPQETSLKWDQENVHQVEQILSAKAEQVPDFRTTLISSGTSILAEATTHKFWATGIASPNIAKTTKPDYWSGENKLGQILMDLREYLQDQEAEPQKTPQIPPVLDLPTEHWSTAESAGDEDETNEEGEDEEESEKERVKSSTKKTRNITSYLMRKRRPTKTPPTANAKKKPLIRSEALIS